MSSSCFGFAPEPSVLLPVFSTGFAPEPGCHPHAGSRRGTTTVPVAAPSAHVKTMDSWLKSPFIQEITPQFPLHIQKTQNNPPLSINSPEKLQNFSCLLNCGANQPETE